MHHRTLFLTALALLAVTPACGVHAQDLALDGASVNPFEPPVAKTGAANHGADRKFGIKAPQSADSSKEKHPEFGWTGTYGGIHVGGGSGVGNQGDP